MVSGRLNPKQKNVCELMGVAMEKRATSLQQVTIDTVQPLSIHQRVWLNRREPNQNQNSGAGESRER